MPMDARTYEGNCVVNTVRRNLLNNMSPKINDLTEDSSCFSPSFEVEE
jgi:hypothetical protein